MFVLGKIKILRSVEDIAEMAFLLFACLYWAVILIPADVECDLIERKYWQSGFAEFESKSRFLNIVTRSFRHQG